MTPYIKKLLEAEIESARKKFPGNRDMLAALMEEVGELANALLEVKRGTLSQCAILNEAIQVACMAIRIAEEGDSAFPYRFEEDEEPEAQDGLLKFPFAQIVEAFPEVIGMLTPGQMGMLMAEIKNKEALTRTILIYKGNYNRSKNQYLPEKVGNFINVYKSELMKLEKENGTNKNSNRRTSKSDEWKQTVDEYQELYRSYGDNGDS